MNSLQKLLIEFGRTCEGVDNPEMEPVGVGENILLEVATVFRRKVNVTSRTLKKELEIAIGLNESFSNIKEPKKKEKNLEDYLLDYGKVSHVIYNPESAAREIALIISMLCEKYKIDTNGMCNDLLDLTKLYKGMNKKILREAEREVENNLSEILFEYGEIASYMQNPESIYLEISAFLSKHLTGKGKVRAEQLEEELLSIIETWHELNAEYEFGCD